MKLLENLKKIVVEQNLSQDTDADYSKSIGRISPFNISPSATAEAMKAALSKYGKKFQKLGSTSDYSLPGVSQDEKYKPESVERFMQWYSDVIRDPDSVTFRGKAFEGLIGGIFNGIVTNNETSDKSNKTDVQIGEENVSVKFRENFNPNGSQDLGGVTSAFDRFFKDPENRKKFPRMEFPTRVTADKLPKFIQTLANKVPVEQLRPLLFSILNNSDSFGPIDWFIFSTLGNRNEILVYQYKKADIISKIVDEIITDNSKIYGGMLGIQNLSKVPTSIFRIKFPQYLKNLQRYKYEISKSDTENSNEKFIVKDKNGEIVGKVLKNIENGEIHYNVVKLSKYATITREMELEAISAYILDDINLLENKLDKLFEERKQYKGTGSRIVKQNLDVKIDQVKQIIDQLKRKSVTIGRELINEKNKLYKTGVEQNLQTVFGSRGESMSPFVIQQIRKNPDRFLKSFLRIYKDNPKRMRNFEKIIQQINKD